MMEQTSALPHILYLMVCAAPPAQQTTHTVQHLQEAGWDVCIIATPQVARWIDRSALAQLTGHVVRTDFRLPWEADPLPKADAMLVMPATFNTINKWAQGIADTLVTGILCETLGRRTPPVLAVPYLKRDLGRHPTFKKSVALLRKCGVRVLHEPERYPSSSMIPFDEILAMLQMMMQEGDAQKKNTGGE